MFPNQDHADREENIKANQSGEQVGFDLFHEVVPGSNERLNYNKSEVLLCVTTGSLLTGSQKAGLKAGPELAVMLCQQNHRL